VSRKPLRRDRRILRLSPVPVLLLLVGTGTTIGVLAVLNVHLNDAADIAAAAAALFAGTAAWLQWFLDRAGPESKRSPALDASTLNDWKAWLLSRVSDARFEANSQLDQMIRVGKTIELSGHAGIELSEVDDERPRLLVRNKIVPWSRITQEWDRGVDRFVILGEPGYGKTVAALSLIAHIDARANGSDSVAELFGLADWFRWQNANPSAPLASWLADQLVLSYPGLSAEVAHELVHRGLVLPVFDGLDEIRSVGDRRRFVDALTAYVRRSGPPRPFVLTCRFAEYDALAPDLVESDRVVVLMGLLPEQVADILHDRMRGRAGWRKVRRRYVEGDNTLRELFRSPLRLTVALQAFRDRDPQELLGLGLDQATRKLWDLVLLSNSAPFDGHEPAAIIHWLRCIAASIAASGRQRLLLHELPMLYPNPLWGEKGFRFILGCTVGVAFAAYGWVFGTFWTGIAIGVAEGAAVALLVQLVPTVSALASWRARRALMVSALPRALAIGIPIGIVVAVLSSVAVGVADAIVLAISTGFILTVRTESEAIIGEPPQRFAGRYLNTILVASRRRGLLVGLLSGVYYGAASTLFALTVHGLGLQLGVGLGIFLSGLWLGFRPLGLWVVGAGAAAIAAG
jgi:NACHT domain